MTLQRLDHVNIRTAHLPAMVRFYRDILGLEPGARPPFDVGGAWLYLGDQAAVHLVEVARPPTARTPRLEHFAFMATGLARFLAHLRTHGVAYEIAIVPDVNNRQVNLSDPDGNHIEVQFGSEEQADLSDFPAT